jgi:hypothetical protein
MKKCSLIDSFPWKPQRVSRTLSLVSRSGEEPPRSSLLGLVESVPVDQVGNPPLPGPQIQIPLEALRHVLGARGSRHMGSHCNQRQEFKEIELNRLS